MHFFLKLFALFPFFVFANFEKSQIRITGSASVYPVTSYIYEHSSAEFKKSLKKDIIIESVGTGAGFDALCKQKFNSNSPDVVNASRSVTEKELKECAKNGITNLQKITLGLDGITIAYIESRNGFTNLKLTIQEISLAISKYIVKDGKVIENPNKMWSDVREDLPKMKILFYGPSSNSGTYDFFKEVIQHSCLSNPIMKKHFGENVKKECGILNSNYNQMQDQDSAIANKIKLQKNAVGILRFAFYEKSGMFTAAEIENFEPTEEIIISKKYKLARPLFLYYIPANIAKVEGLKEFLTQVAKFSYKDLIKPQNNEFKNSSDILIGLKGSVKECEENKKIIGFQFNCK